MQIFIGYFLIAAGSCVLVCGGIKAANANHTMTTDLPSGTYRTRWENNKFIVKDKKTGKIWATYVQEKRGEA